MRIAPLSLTILCAGGWFTASAAADVTPTQYSAFAEAYAGPSAGLYYQLLYQPGTIRSGYGSTISATAAITAGNDPQVSGSVISNAALIGEPYFGETISDLSYSFEVVGPDSPNVRVNLMSELSTIDDAGGHALSLASLAIAQPSGDPLLSRTACSGDAAEAALYGCVVTTGPLDVNVTLSLPANEVFFVDLSAFNLLNYDSFTAPVSVLASVDPILSLTPDELRDYSILFSPGLVATPEPGSWLLLATGAASAVSMMRRQRQG